jgi:hypothetical protein
MAMMKVSDEEFRTLTATRDALLRSLLSGDVLTA